MTIVCLKCGKYSVSEVLNETVQFVTDHIECTLHSNCTIKPSKSVDDRLTDRSCKLINQGKSIRLKRLDGSYLGCWTNIAAGPDRAHWSKKQNALEMFDLKWAFAIAKLYNCKVYSSK